MVDPPSPRHWIVVADSPFLPAHGGGEREHLGFVQVAQAENLIAALVVPADRDPAAAGRRDDLRALERLVAPAPVITLPRSRSVRAALHPLRPYVVASRPPSANLVRQVQDQAPEADAVIIYSYKSHEVGRVLAQGLRLPAVLRQHNLEGDYHLALAAAAKAPRSWGIRFEAMRIARDEERLEKAPWLTGIADISATDAEIRSKRARVPVKYVPTFALGLHSLERPTRRPADPPIVVFVGALDVATNHDAIRWFATKVWPSVLRVVPKARWQIVGRNPSEFIERLLAATPQTELHPNVGSTAEFLAAASVAVNPAVSGSGVNIKVVEYLAAGVPVVSTTRGIRGFGLSSGRDIAVQDDADAFARAVAALLTDSASAAALGAAGQSTALNILDSHKSLMALASLLSPKDPG